MDSASSPKARARAVWLGHASVAVGAVLLAINAAAVIQFRHHAKELAEPSLALPYNIVVQILVAFLLCLWGVTKFAGEFKLKLAGEDFARVPSACVLEHRDDFMRLNHRGRILTKQYGL